MRNAALLAGLCFVAFFWCCSESVPQGSGWCASDADCDAGQVCRGGVCRTECTTSTDCPDGQMCVSGICLTNCQSDGDCPDGEECVNGFCQPESQDDGGLPDGQTDGGDPGPCQPGSQRSCGSDVGTCESGSQTCRADSTWGDCLGEVLPEEEDCDGLDNDCDGLTDEDLTYNGFCMTAGVCAGTLAVCENLQWVCHYPPEYSSPDTTCDGIDNDCDGQPDSGLECGGVCCAPGELCRDDLCIPNIGNCVEDGDCQEDSHCVNGECIPYQDGETNQDCTRLIIAGLFQPALQCQWTAPPPGEYDNHIQVLGTPTVADFNFDNDPATIKPSIVFNTYDALDGDSGVQTSLDGVLRIIDGETCQTQFSLGPYLNGCNPVAIGDLDGDADGRPEIVAHKNNAGVIAFKYNASTGAWVTLWEGHLAGGTPVAFSEGDSGWGGPSLADLDDDGLPEVLSGGLVYDSTGLLLDNSLGLGVLFRVGFPAVADLEDDGWVELTGGNAIWEFDPGARNWVAEWSGGTSGYTAIADFGTYPENAAGDDRSTLDGVAEVGVVAVGFARIDNRYGRTVFGPIPLPASSGGGPPTIGDFDGDGRAEMAAAGSDSMSVFDPDCQGAPAAGTCPTLATNGILWSQVSQDHSSNITGSSLFDFEGDGLVEAVYADECFVRVYNGSDGTVLYSQWRSSCSWNENPIVADVDGDFSSELVVPSNQNCSIVPQSMGGTQYETSPAGNPMDPLFVGLRCEDGLDCMSGNCDSGYCRCTQDDQCGGGGFVCAPPPGGTPGVGNTCRAEWQGRINGVRVYRDSLDRWVGSRTIWNQHAYSITNVNEDGTIPRTSDVQANWKVPGLNNFRQNIQGDLNPDHSPDMTGGSGLFLDDQCASGIATLVVRVCNRGTNPIGDGVSVGFFDEDPDLGGLLVCSSATSQVLQPGECEEIHCDWADAPVDDPKDITVMVDYDSDRTECLETNNRAMILDVSCSLT